MRDTWLYAVDVAVLKDGNEFYDSMVDEALNGSTHQVRLDVGVSGNTSHVLDAIDVGQKLEELTHLIKFDAMFK